MARKTELEELRKRRDAAKVIVAEAAAQLEATRARTAAQVVEAEKVCALARIIFINFFSSERV